MIVVTVHFTHAAASHAHSRSYNVNQWWLILSVGIFYSKLFFRTYDCLYTLVTFDFSFQKGIFTQILISTIRKYLSHSVMRGESKHTVLSRSVSYNSEICPRNNSFQNLKKSSLCSFSSTITFQACLTEHREDIRRWNVLGQSMACLWNIGK